MQFKSSWKEVSKIAHILDVYFRFAQARFILTGFRISVSRLAIGHVRSHSLQLAEIQYASNSLPRPTHQYQACFRIDLTRVFP